MGKTRVHLPDSVQTLISGTGRAIRELRDTGVLPLSSRGTIMSDTTTRDYYVSRAVAERYKAENSVNDITAAVHRELAERYDERVRAIDTQPPMPIG